MKRRSMPDFDATPSPLHTKPRRRGFRRLLLVALPAIAILGSAFGAYTSLVLEESDEFCIACHRPPEQAYFDRARQAQDGGAPADLSSVHMATRLLAFNCIVCHRGASGIGDRILSVMLGARDTLIHFARAGDPALEKRSAALPDLIDRSCVKCHVDAIVIAGFENHFHVKLPAAWRAIQSGVAPVAPPDLPPGSPDPLADSQGKPEPLDTTVTCLACHVAHASGFESVNFLDESVYLPACDACHIETNRGPKGLAP